MVLQPTQVDLRVVKLASPPIFEVTTERVRVWSPSRTRQMVQLCLENKGKESAFT